MPNSEGPGGARVLPAHPNLEHLKNEAKQRLRALRNADTAAKLAEAQFQIAREYGFASWRKLKVEVERQVLAAAIASGDIRQALALGASATDIGRILQAAGRDIDPNTAVWVKTPLGRVALGYTRPPPNGRNVMFIPPEIVDYVPSGGVDNLPTVQEALGPQPPPPPPSAAMLAVGQMVLAGVSPQEVAVAMHAVGVIAPYDPTDPPLDLDFSTASFVRQRSDVVSISITSSDGLKRYTRPIPGTAAYGGLASLPMLPPPEPVF